VNERIAESLESNHFSDEQREQLNTLIEPAKGDFAALALEKTNSAIEVIPASRKELRDSAFKFQGKVMPVMDWHAVGCSTIDIAILGALALCIPTEGAGCVVALGGMIAHAAFC
jgi:hypothetical protein